MLFKQLLTVIRLWAYYFYLLHCTICTMDVFRAFLGSKSHVNSIV